MRVFAAAMFGWVRWTARKGLAEGAAPGTTNVQKCAGRRTGIRGETYAYWYLRRCGYTVIARNYTARGIKGEIDLVGYDGAVLAFVEVKTRAGEASYGLPEDAVTPDKRRHLSRMARLFLTEWRIRETPYRFDVLAIQALSGGPPIVRLHKGAFADG